MYSQAMLLRRRGLSDLAEELLEKIEKQADIQGIPEGKILALLQLRNLSSSSQDVGWKLKKEIEEAIDQYKQDILAAGYFDEFRVLHSGKTSSDPEKISFLKEATQRLEKELENTYSVRAHYYYLDMMVSLHSLQLEVDSCRNVLQEQVDLVASQPGLKTSTRQGIPMLRLARLELMYGNFEAAYIASEQARNTFSPKRNNYLSASAYFLFASIYTDRIKEVFEALQSLPPLMARKKEFPSTPIIQYLFSCAWFIMNDFKRAGAALDEAENLLTDKGGWNIGIRIYEIMILIEKEHVDIASNRIETLRKHIGRYKVTERENLIYRYLYLLDKSAFDFSSPNAETDQILLKLKSEIAWVPVSHEVIRFDSWVISKKEGTSFYEQFLRDIKGEKVNS
jgi:tetratricopeptide (TPR) repeat protein